MKGFEWEFLVRNLDIATTRSLASFGFAIDGEVHKRIESTLNLYGRALSN